MFSRILLPLDGSRLAEAAVPVAAYLAKTVGALVTLVHVIERNAPQQIHGERHLSDPTEAHVYLDAIRTRAFPSDVRVERHVHTAEVGNVAQSIVEHIAELTPDLIVMCTHGRGGLRDLLFGSIAQRVVSLGTIPVVLVRPADAKAPPHFVCHVLLIPLDGTPSHEVGLPVAAELAKACRAELHLLMVVPTIGDLLGERAATARLLPKTSSAILEIAEKSAEEYVGRYVAQMKESGLAVSSEVLQGDPTTVIVNTAQRVKASLIVLGTHGKVGMDALWSGSVAPKIAGHTHVPLLLVPVHAEK